MSESRWRRGPHLSRIVWGGAVTTVLVVVVFLFVVPAGTYLKQRHQISTASSRLRVLTQQNSELATQIQKLQTNAEIERLARQQYHLVRPGEQAYAILPAPAPTTTTVPPPAVVHRQAGHHGLGRLWADVTGWL